MKTHEFILNDGHNQPDYNAHVYLSETTDGRPYYTIVTLLRPNGMENYVVTSTKHFTDGLTLDMLKAEKYGIAVINWFKENTNIK